MPQINQLYTSDFLSFDDTQYWLQGEGLGVESAGDLPVAEFLLFSSLDLLSFLNGVA